jgi:hypothetical protein
MTDVIIDTEDRFIGKYKNHRISIARISLNFFDADVQDSTHLVLEMQEYFIDIEAAKQSMIDYIDKLYN